MAVESSFGSFFKDVAPVFVGVLALIFAYYQNSKTLRAAAEQNEKILSSKTQAEKRSEIYKKLNDFYGPIIQLRRKSQLLYDKFSERLRNEDPDFATLTYLLNKGTLTSNEDILLKEIIEIGGRIETLIREKAGLIDVPALRLDIIPRASTHFLVMQLAYKGALVGDAAKFRDLSFPRNLDAELEARKLQLEQELDILNKL